LPSFVWARLRCSGVTIAYTLRLVKECPRRGAILLWENMTMDKPMPKGKITLSLHQLWIEIEHEALYPDQITDMSSRAFELFVSALNHCKEVGMDIRNFDFAEFDDDEDD
jgi:hypothetical protein